MSPVQPGSQKGNLRRWFALSWKVTAVIALLMLMSIVIVLTRKL